MMKQCFFLLFRMAKLLHENNVCKKVLFGDIVTKR